MRIRKLILTTTLFVLATVSVTFANVQGADEREDEQSQDEKKGRLVEARYYSKSGREEGEQTDKKLFMIISYPEYPEYSPDTWTFAYDESNRMKTASMYELYSTDTYSKTWEAGYAFKYDMYGNCTGVTTTRRNTEKFANSELDSAPYFSYEEWEYIYDYSYTAPAKFYIKNYHPRTMGYSWFPKDITVFGGADPWA